MDDPQFIDKYDIDMVKFTTFRYIDIPSLYIFIYQHYNVHLYIYRQNLALFGIYVERGV